MTFDVADLEAIYSEIKRPPDFDGFWDGVKAELAKAPLDWERIPDPDLSTPDQPIDIIRFASLGGQSIYGWYAPPKDIVEENAANGFLWLPGYSLGNPRPKAESLYPRTATFGLNLHGNLPNTPYVHPSKNNEDYITQGIESPRTYIYRQLTANCLRAMDVLAAQPEVDPRRLIVGGMSQGGGLALVTAALRDDIRLCFADMPWLSDLDLALSLVDLDVYRRARNRRVPDARMLVAFHAEEHPEQSEEIYQTYRYFDPVSHAGNIRCPVQMSAGGRDPSCRPPTIYSVYNHITSEKEMLYLPETGHEIVAEMHVAHARWLRSKLQ